MPVAWLGPGCWSLLGFRVKISGSQEREEEGREWVGGGGRGGSTVVNT